MPNAPADISDHRDTVTTAILADGFRRATFAGKPRSGPTPWVRVIVRPITVRGRRHLQFSYFDGKQTTAKNALPEEAGPPLAELLAVGFSGVHISTATEEIDLRLTKKGKVLVGRRPARATDAEAEPHNRTKDLPLPEGRADHLLETLGIATADGRVRPTMRAKFTQVNEFLTHLRHGIDDAGLRTLARPLTVLDCGCGSSYLTLSAHHYLNDIINLPATLIGVDVNDELIRKSVDRSHRVGAEALSFACGRIGSADVPADVVLALHACDTATDDAIAQAVRSGAKLLLSVPCCHHELNHRVRPAGPATALRPVLRHGILKQRTADIVTDAFRALALRVMGYRTEVIEFVSPEHTARNLMIRGVGGLAVGDPAFVAEYREMRAFWGVTPYIEQALGEQFARLVND